MDEPCSALDPIATARIEDLMQEIKSEYTILIVTHNMQQAARVSDKTAFFTTEVQARHRHPDRFAGRVRPAPRRSSRIPPTSERRTMSPAASAEPEHPLRLHFTSELQELKLQTEMMGVLVDQNLERMREVLLSGDEVTAGHAVDADDDIDAMNVSLIDQCYEVLARENPMASDLRLVVSVIRVTSTFERVGDLSLRVVKLAPEHHVLTANSTSFDILHVMSDLAVERFRDAWM